MVRKNKKPDPMAQALGQRGGKKFAERVKKLTPAERKKFEAEMSKRGASGAAKRWAKKGGKK